MNECFVPVTTSPPISPGSNLSRLRYDPDGLNIVLVAPEETIYEIRFSVPQAYQVTDEGDRLRSMEYLDGRAATPLGYIENSKWLTWFIEETLDIRKNDPLIHWCVVTQNEIVDVIATDPPLVSITDPGA